MIKKFLNKLGNKIIYKFLFVKSDKCPYCKCTEIKKTHIDIIDGIVCEETYECKFCGYLIGWFSYGHTFYWYEYDGGYCYPWFVIVQFIWMKLTTKKWKGK